MAPPKKKKTPTGPLVQNKPARYQFEIIETLEAGIALTGTEVKSIREGRASIQEAFVKEEHGELWLTNANIDPYDFGNIHNHNPRRRRKLLIHKYELRKWMKKVGEKGLSLIPLNFHLKQGKIKIDIALGRGKKLHDKRGDIKERDQKREIARAQKDRGRF